MYKYEYDKEKRIMTVLNEEEKILAKGIFNPYMPSDIYEPRLEIFIEIIECVEDHSLELKRCLVNEFIRQAAMIKEKHPSLPVHLYHCCFAEDTNNISFYLGIEEFEHDEGMHIINNNINHRINTSEIKEIEFKYLTLDNDQIHELINEQKKVFRSGYTFEDLIEIRKSARWFSLATLQADKMIGNIMVIIKQDEQGNEFAWIDDLFVKKECRELGIGQELVNRTMNKLYEMGINYCQLEVWSSNEKAYSIYKKAGFKFLKETQVSIGMFL